MRLIDADALSDKVAESKHDNPHPQGMIRVNHRNEHDHFWRMIMNAPTVDAVPVVRCKDCIHLTPKKGRLPLCMRYNTAVFYGDFCSCGERKENNE